MATLSFVYGKCPLSIKWQIDIVVFKMANNQVLLPMATKRYVKFIYYANITYSSEERSWVLEI